MLRARHSSYTFCLHGHVSCDVKYIATDIPNDCRTDEMNEFKVELICPSSDILCSGESDLAAPYHLGTGCMVPLEFMLRCNYIQRKKEVPEDDNTGSNWKEGAMAEIVAAMQQTDERKRREENGKKKNSAGCISTYRRGSCQRCRIQLGEPNRGGPICPGGFAQYPFCPSHSVCSYPDLDPSHFAVAEVVEEV
jgi:hypothetical protein